MTNGLDKSKVRWLTYLVYFLITLISLITAYNTNTIAEFRDKYLKLERYQSDQVKIEKKLDRMLEFMIDWRRR